MPSVPRSRIWLAAIVAVAVVLRLGFFLADPNPARNSGRSSGSGDIARNILVHGRWDFVLTATPGWPRRPPGAHGLVDISDLDWSGADRNPRYLPSLSLTPGEAILLAGLWRVTGDYDYGYAQVLQILIDSSMPLLIFWMGMALFGRRRAALLAAAGYALFVPIARASAIPDVDIWAIDLNIVGAALFLKALGAQRKWPWLVATGLVCGVGIWFRPIMAPFAMAIAAAFWIGLRRAAVMFAVPAVITILAITPWLVRNEHEFHRLIYRSGTGQGTWEGLGVLPNSFGAQLNDPATLRMVHRARPDIGYGTIEFDDYLRKKAIKAIKAHPAFYAEVLGYRLVVGLVVAHAPLDLGVQPAPLASWKGAVHAVQQALKPLLFLLVLVTLIGSWRRYRREYALLLAIPIATIAPYLLFNLVIEYALPASFAYLLIAGVGIDLALERRAATRPVAAAGQPAAESR